MTEALAFLGVIVVGNLLALIAYVAVPPLAPLVFVALNGYLLGREYFDLIARRRLGRDGARRMRRRHPLQIWVAGMLMAAPLTVPVINLAIPVLGAATFTHLFHRLARSLPSG
jgi:uncharacterized protein involved in cysteine biosynthesis